MLRVRIPKAELYLEGESRFHTVKATTLVLEHSLVSVSKWEAIFKKPFLSRQEKTSSEILKYIECMTITQNVDPYVYYVIPPDALQTIVEYIDDDQTATWFSEDPDGRKPKQEVITSEVIYYWMSTMQIDKECEKWHLSRLITVIRVASEKNKPAKKVKPQDAVARNAALNAARRAKYNSAG